MNDLPPLPPSLINVEVWDSEVRGLHQANAAYYSADQMQAYAREYARAAVEAETRSFWGQDKPAACADGCPPNQICEYCQLVRPARELVAKAVADENEACAKACEADAFVDQWPGLKEAVRRIRARRQEAALQRLADLTQEMGGEL